MPFEITALDLNTPEAGVKRYVVPDRDGLMDANLNDVVVEARDVQWRTLCDRNYPLPYPGNGPDGPDADRANLIKAENERLASL